MPHQQGIAVSTPLPQAIKEEEDAAMEEDVQRNLVEMLMGRHMQVRSKK